MNDVSGIVSVNNALATKEHGEPNHAGNAGGKSVWWQWTAPEDGVLFLSTTNSTFDTLMGLYTGDRVDSLTTIASNDDAYNGVSFSKITQAVRANQLYHIAVDGYGGASGTISLTYAFTRSQLFTLTLAAPTNGTIIPAAGVSSYQSNATVTLFATPSPFYYFAGWQGDVTSSANPLSVVMSTNLTLAASFLPHALSDDFETGNLSKLPWVTAGNAPWRVQTKIVSRGTFAAESGAIGDSQSSSLILTSGMFSGTGSFDYKVSSEDGFDLFQFYLNGQLQQTWSGEVGWANYQFSVPSGTNILEWRYTKDISHTAGLDASFIDNVDLPLIVPVDRFAPALLSAGTSGGILQIRLSGQSGQQYVIQASANLINWQSISTNIAVDGVIQFSDPDSANRSLRFYRAIVPSTRH